MQRQNLPISTPPPPPAHPLEAAGEVELALHHVEEDGDGGLAQLNLRHQRHLQDGPHHLRDELVLVGPLSKWG